MPSFKIDTLLLVNVNGIWFWNSYTIILNGGQKEDVNA